MYKCLSCNYVQVRGGGCYCCGNETVDIGDVGDVGDDVVKVVRCKDCKYGIREDKTNLIRCYRVNYYLEDTDYCSKGERR